MHTSSSMHTVHALDSNCNVVVYTHVYTCTVPGWRLAPTCLPPMTQYFFTVFIHIVLATMHTAAPIYFTNSYIQYELVVRYGCYAYERTLYAGRSTCTRVCMYACSKRVVYEPRNILSYINIIRVVEYITRKLL